MKDDVLVCPDCGARHEMEDLLRCRSCYGYLLDNSPWRADHNIVAVPVALVIWGTVMLAVWWGPELIAGSDGAASWGRRIFSDGISQCILLLGIYGMMVLQMKARVTRRQNAAFRMVRRIAADDSFSGQPDALASVRHQVTQVGLGPYNQLLSYTRLHTVCTSDDERQALMTQLSHQAESDWDALESALASTQFLVWLLPTAGFLGTVYGMTRALKSFSTVVASSSDLSFTAGLTATAQGLGVAFHTTLVGLAAVIPLLALATAVRKRARNLLERMDKYFMRMAAGAHRLAVDAPITGSPTEAPTDERVIDDASFAYPPSLGDESRDAHGGSAISARVDDAPFEAHLGDGEVIESVTRVDPEPIQPLPNVGNDNYLNTPLTSPGEPPSTPDMPMPGAVPEVLDSWLSSQDTTKPNADRPPSV